MKRLLFVLSLLIVFIDVNAQEGTKPFYLWNTNALKGMVAHNTILSFANRTTYNITAKEISASYHEMVASYIINNTFSVGAGYRNEHTRKSEQWNAENRLMAYLYYKNAGSRTKIFFTNRLSYRMFSWTNNHWRHYQKLSVFYPVTMYDFTFHPFVAEETFIKLNNDNLHLARFFAGVRLWPQYRINIDCYYGICSTKPTDGNWGSYQLTAIDVVFKL